MTRIYKIILILVLLSIGMLVLNSFFFIIKKKGGEGHKVKETTFTHVTHVIDKNQFDQMSGMPLVAKYNGVSTVKVVYELATKKLYFVNSNRYKFHHEFCEDVLGYNKGLELFNQTNYTNTTLRNYVLANLNYYPSLNIYAVEFVTEDDLKASHVQDLFNAIQKQSYLNQHLKLLVNGDYLEALQSKLLSIAFISPDEIYTSLSYQVIQEGVTYGKLHYVEGSKNYGLANADEILVVKGSPIYFPPCKGIITNQFQTPLSHIQILSHNLKLPSFAYKNIWNDAYRKYDNKYVKVIIGVDSFSIVEIDKETFLKYNQTAEVKIVNLFADTLFSEIAPLKQFNSKDKLRIGNKACNLAILEKIASKNKKLFYTPEGSFAIPFYYYHQHMKIIPIQKQMQWVLLNVKQWDMEQLSIELKKLRQLIKNSSFNTGVLNLVEKQIVKNNLGNSYRFRSSSNAEDASGFSGAGIYESKTGIYLDSNKTIEDAMKKVWASTWNLEAFMAREQAKMNHKEVKMAILCHRNFGTEDANGVVVTKNIYRPSFLGYTANVQVNEISVVEPDSMVVCDQFTFFKPTDFNPFSDNIAVDYITVGNQNGGKKVLSAAQIKQLYEAIFVCEDYFAQAFYRSHAYDIEFKFLNGKLYLKQIRPYY